MPAGQTDIHCDTQSLRCGMYQSTAAYMYIHVYVAIYMYMYVGLWLGGLLHFYFLSLS